VLCVQANVVPEVVQGAANTRVTPAAVFAPSELLRSDGEPTSLSVRVADAAAAKLLARHCILCEKIFGDVLLVWRHPSGEGQHEKLQRQARHPPRT
jgi:hypothetical protein